MADDRYILRVYDADGALHEVELSDLAYGYLGVAVTPSVLDFENPILEELVNEPEDSPPDGELPVYDENGTQHLIAYALSGVNGLYELTQNALYGLVQDAAASLSLSMGYENAPVTQPDPANAPWAEARIEWGPHEAIAFGSSRNRYRLRGDLAVRVYVGLDEGVVGALTVAAGLVAALRSQSIDPVTTYDAYHTAIQRDGGWWTCEVLCEFRSNRDYTIEDN